MTHVVGAFVADVQSNQFVLTPERAIDQQTVRTLEDGGLTILPEP